MALANDPDLLLADEITGEVGSSSADIVVRIDPIDARREHAMPVCAPNTDNASRPRGRLASQNHFC